MSKKWRSQSLRVMRAFMAKSLPMVGLYLMGVSFCMLGSLRARALATLCSRVV
jgi:hypothetical protein